jgi:hypothetical protein
MNTFAKAYFLSLTLLSAAAFADNTVFVDTVALTGEEPRRGETVYKLVVTEIENLKGYTILNADRAKADFVVSPSLTRLESASVLNIKLSGQQNRAQSVRIERFDEVDTAVARLVRAVFENKSIADTAAQGEILDRDQKNFSQVKSIKGWTFNVGPAIAPNAFSESANWWAFGLGYAWDVRDAFVELNANFMGRFGANLSSYSNFVLTYNHILSDSGRSAFYAGGEFGFGSSTTETDSGSGLSSLLGVSAATGFNLGASAGVLLMRHADINLDFRFRVAFLTSKLLGETPVVSSLTAGLHF